MRQAVKMCGLALVDAAQELFKYRRDKGGFTGWLRPGFPAFHSAPRIRRLRSKSVNPELFAQCANITPRALAEIAKTEPDVQALINERVEAGEIFTAAKVKEIRDEAGVIAGLPSQASRRKAGPNRTNAAANHGTLQHRRPEGFPRCRHAEIDALPRQHL
ncbi:hypothetical protein [Rhizobium mongolense]